MEKNPTESGSVFSHAFRVESSSAFGGFLRYSSPTFMIVSRPARSVVKKPAYLLLMPLSSLTKVKWLPLYCMGKRAWPYFIFDICVTCLNSLLFQLSTRNILKLFRAGRTVSPLGASPDGLLEEKMMPLLLGNATKDASRSS